MNRAARVFMHDQKAGILHETEEGFSFSYDSDYIIKPDAQAISLTLPLSDQEYISSILFPFFDGLIPEGWLLDVAQNIWKLDTRDRMGLLLTCCKECIGAVSIEPTNPGKVQ